MWYIVKTDYYKEDEAVTEFGKISIIQNTYLPVYRKPLNVQGGGKSKKFKFCPTISGILFINVKNEEEEQLIHYLTPNGYFKTSEGRFESNAHLLNFFTEPLSLGEMLAMARIPNEDIYRFRIHNEQLAENMEDLKVLDVSYHELEAENDTVCITEGPYIGFQGVIKQVKRHGVKDRHLFFRMGNWCISVSGVRRFNYIVIREAQKGVKALVTNTYRYIDHLIGRLQATYFIDDASDALRSILAHLNKDITIADCRQQMLLSASNIKDAEARRNIALQGAFLDQMDAKTESNLLSLSRYFQTVDDSIVKGLAALIPEVQLRPFLTPTSGLEIPKGGHFAVLPHRDFTEVIFRLNLKEVFISEKIYKPLSIIYQREGVYKKGSKKGQPYAPKVVKSSDEDYIYYAHVALMENKTGDAVTAFVNWSGFIQDYQQMDEEERQTFLSELEARSYPRMSSLFKEGTIHYESPIFAGFSTEIKGVSLPKLERKLSKSMSSKTLSPSFLRSFYPVVTLLKLCVPAAVEMWQKQRFLEKRHLLQQFVLLHKQQLEGMD